MKSILPSNARQHALYLGARLAISLIIILTSATVNSLPRCFAQAFGSPGQSSGDIQFDVDVNAFRYAGSQMKVEIYYSIPVSELTFTSVEDEFRAHFQTHLRITDSAGAIAHEDTVETITFVPRLYQTTDPHRSVVDQRDAYLAPGGYALDLTVKDLRADKTGAYQGELVVPAVPVEGVAISQVQLSSFIKTDTTASKFTKNRKYVLPVASRSYQCQKAQLFVYFEVYNLAVGDTGQANTFSVDYTIVDAAGKTALELPTRLVSKPGASCVKVQAIDIRSLPIGDYRLVTEVRDNATNARASADKSFAIIEAVDLLQHLPMSDADVENYYDQLKYIAAPGDLKMFRSLDRKGKENFLLQFWRDKDPTPETDKNEFMVDHFARIKYANEHFKGSGSGLDTDMGRIFVVYGPPGEIENHEWETTTKPYVIWHYFSLGGRHDFVFVDLSNDGIYYLVHSTYPEEVKDESWILRAQR